VTLRAGLVGFGLVALAALPAAALASAGVGVYALVDSVGAGLLAALDAVGWVFVPQLVLAVAILSLVLQQLAARAAGVEPPSTPGWLDPAVESALLLGLLGTVSGMVLGFTSISPGELEPGPLVHALGTALRSTFVGFAIALVGVWARSQA
jgi:hypothetical protein